MGPTCQCPLSSSSLLLCLLYSLPLFDAKKGAEWRGQRLWHGEKAAKTNDAVILAWWRWQHAYALPSSSARCPPSHAGLGPPSQGITWIWPRTWAGSTAATLLLFVSSGEEKLELKLHNRRSPLLGKCPSLTWGGEDAASGCRGQQEESIWPIDERGASSMPTDIHHSVLPLRGVSRYCQMLLCLWHDSEGGGMWRSL